MPHNQQNTHWILVEEKPFSNVNTEDAFKKMVGVWCRDWYNIRIYNLYIRWKGWIESIKKYLHACTIVDPAKRNVNKKPGFIVWFEAMYKRFHTNHNGSQCERIVIVYVCSVVRICVRCYLMNGSQCWSTHGQWSPPLPPLPPSPLPRSRK